VVLSGKQKAALLLMGLDAATAAELLKGVDPQTVQELAVEVAYLDASGFSSISQTTEVARQFYLSLENSRGLDVQNFLATMLKMTVGPEKAERIQAQIRDLLQKRDPFIAIRHADSKTLASILAGEHPQTVSVVLAELPARKSSEVLALLDEPLRLKVVTRMAAAEPVLADTKMRIAQMVCRRLESAQGDTAGLEKAPRKVALMLRNLSKEIRDGLISSIAQKDAEAGRLISEQMLLWEDIPDIADRSLQEALRQADLKKLALALVSADEGVARKIKANMSERAAAMLDEETALLASPRKADIQQAREDITALLRQMNEKGELNFNEE